MAITRVGLEDSEGLLTPRRKRKRGPPPFTLEPGFEFNYLDLSVLKLFIGERGLILPRRVTRLTQKQQRALARAIKRARQLALLPYTRQGT